MASYLDYKVYVGKDLRAAVRYCEDAAILVGGLGDGTVIKCNGRIVWREGREEISAAESYDRVTRIVHDRLVRHHQEALARYRRAS